MAVLTVKQAAERLQVAPTTIYGLCAQKRLAHIRIGAAGRGTIRIPEESLARYMTGATVQPDEPAAPPPPKEQLKHLMI